MPKTRSESTKTSASLISNFLKHCELELTPKNPTYGFSVHHNIQKDSQILINIVPGGPADLAGCKHQDRIIEVNGHNVTNYDHDTVCAIISDSINRGLKNLSLALVEVEKESEICFWVGERKKIFLKFFLKKIIFLIENAPFSLEMHFLLQITTTKVIILTFTGSNHVHQTFRRFKSIHDTIRARKAQSFT